MSLTDGVRGVATIAGVLLATAVGVAVGWYVFVQYPQTGAELAGLLLALLVALIAGKLVGNVLGNVFDDYNVAEVGVDGPISRNGGRSSPLSSPMGPTADEIVDAVDRADDDPDVDALLVRLNTPGGEVLPSDDIRRAAERFDGPTVAYATDVCASGGYWIASGCEELWAHEASLVGSIGVLGSRPNAAELAEKLGISYEQFTAGEFKDAGMPLKEMEEAERAYLQGIIDDIYDQFVDTVAEGRGLDPETVRGTEARVFLGSEAVERGLADAIGTREDVEDRIADRLGESVEVREFAPQRGLAERIHLGTQSVAYAFGAGVASTLGVDDGADLDVELK